jgi:uncharacterized membrane protein YkoI
MIISPALLALLALAASTVTAGPWGPEGRDHGEARRLRHAGEILPLERLVDDARRLHPGHVLETELKHRGPRYFYEIEILDDSGVVWELLYDARTGELLETEQED